MTRAIWILLALLLSARAFADDIEVPEEELARETTLPVFNKQRAVLNRNIVTKDHTELAVGAGMEMNEPYYADGMYSFQGTYNWSETSAINLIGLGWLPGLSSYGEQLKAGRVHNPAKANDFPSFDASKAPHPQWGLFANYEYIAYYGKISVTKQTVMNLNLFGLAGVGYINEGTGNAFGINIGAGQNLFFTPHFGLRADLRMLIFDGADPTTVKKGTLTSSSPTPSAGSFGNRIYYNTQIGLSLVFIL